MSISRPPRPAALPDELNGGSLRQTTPNSAPSATEVDPVLTSSFRFPEQTVMALPTSAPAISKSHKLMFLSFLTMQNINTVSNDDHRCQITG
jgi:hypothetical protein